MTWDNQGNLFCNWCGKTVIPENLATKHDKEFNTGWTRCEDCCDKRTPFPKEGKIEDLPDDYNPKILARIVVEKFNPMDSPIVLDRIQRGLCPSCGKDTISCCDKCGTKYL